MNGLLMPSVQIINIQSVGMLLDSGLHANFPSVNENKY